jgi:hypothetical protein
MMYGLPKALTGLDYDLEEINEISPTDVERVKRLLGAS